jgi:hypothetical protein
LNNIVLVIFYVEPLLETKYIPWENLVVINIVAANKPKVRFASKEDFIATQFLKLVSVQFYLLFSF